MEKCADVLDLAQAHMQRETELRIAEIRLRTSGGSGCDLCIDCGVQIPLDRRKQVPNALRCAGCQAAEEYRHAPIPRRA
jgi:phage/conjugal plasmid C-4 type zinc finger TraR family protein